jgi:hypothetical protein
MFLKVVTELPLDFEEVHSMILAEPAAWLSELVPVASEHGDRLLAQVGLEAAERQGGHRTSLEIGQPERTGRLLLLPIRIGVDGHRRLLPSFEGSLDAAWLGRGLTHLALAVSYEPPFESASHAADGVLFHRVVEAMAQRLLESIARELVTRSADPPVRPAAGGGFAERSAPNPVLAAR